LPVASRSWISPAGIFLALDFKQKPLKPAYLLGSRGARLELSPGELLEVIRLRMQVAQGS
jgi:hypothetical protein